MNRYVYILIMPFLFLWAGCMDSKLSTTNLTPPQEIYAALELVNNMSDSELMNEFAVGLDLCLIGEHELLFTDPKEIDSNTLLMFFVYTLSDFDETNKWFNEQDQKYHIPLEAVTSVLNRYFIDYDFRVSEIESYDEAANMIIMNTISGFGGDRYPRLMDKTISNDLLELQVGYFDQEYNIMHYSKTYSIKIEADGYKYLSICKN